MGNGAVCNAGFAKDFSLRFEMTPARTAIPKRHFELSERVFVVS